MSAESRVSTERKMALYFNNCDLMTRCYILALGKMPTGLIMALFTLVLDDWYAILTLIIQVYVMWSCFDAVREVKSGKITLEQALERTQKKIPT